jgi:hypothetical protein
LGSDDGEMREAGGKMKTELTKELENKIYWATSKQGIFGCFEVTIGWFGKERVDYMTYDTKGDFRCYEIKVSESDFNSKNHNTFVGDFNYYVMPTELFNKVKAKIPDYIGVYNESGSSVKKAKRVNTKHDKKVLEDSMIRSLSREFHIVMKNGRTDICQQHISECNRIERKYEDLREKYFDILKRYNELRSTMERTEAI